MCIDKNSATHAQRKRFVGRGKYCVLAIWDDQQPERPAAWSTPFTVEDTDDGKSHTISPAVGEVANRMIDCERYCDMDRKTCDVADLAVRADSELLQSHRRQVGVDQLNRYGLRDLLQLLREDTSSQLRILRLKHYIDADANCLTMDTVLEALEHCTKVEALYIHNFEEGMRDAQLEHLTRVLKKGYIWALNIGENFKLSAKAWCAFAEELPKTHVTHMYASEPHFGGITDKLKLQMRKSIRENRLKDVRHKCISNADVIESIGQMWWNPRNGFNRETALFGVALTPDNLLGAEIKLFSENPERWVDARILALADSKDHPTEGCQVEFKTGGMATVWLSQIKCMLADGFVWAKVSIGRREAQWLPGQRFRHNTLCRHELGRRLAGFACVQLLPSRKMVWVPNRGHSLLPFDENLERLGTPTSETIWGIEAVQRLHGSLSFFRARANQQQHYGDDENRHLGT